MRRWRNGLIRLFPPRQSEGHQSVTTTNPAPESATTPFNLETARQDIARPADLAGHIGEDHAALNLEVREAVVHEDVVFSRS